MFRFTSSEVTNSDIDKATNATVVASAAWLGRSFIGKTVSTIKEHPVPTCLTVVTIAAIYYCCRSTTASRPLINNQVLDYLNNEDSLPMPIQGELSILHGPASFNATCINREAHRQNVSGLEHVRPIPVGLATVKPSYSVTTSPAYFTDAQFKKLADLLKDTELYVSERIFVLLGASPTLGQQQYADCIKIRLVDDLKQDVSLLFNRHQQLTMLSTKSSLAISEKKLKAEKIVLKFKLKRYKEFLEDILSNIHSLYLEDLGQRFFYFYQAIKFLRYHADVVADLGRLYTQDNLNSFHEKLTANIGLVFADIDKAVKQLKGERFSKKRRNEIDNNHLFSVFYQPASAGMSEKYYLMSPFCLAPATNRSIVKVVFEIALSGGDFIILFDRPIACKISYQQDIHGQSVREMMYVMDDTVQFFARGMQGLSYFKYYYLMQIRAGENLYSLMSDSKNNSFTFEQIAALMLTISHALKKLHDKNVVHHDLKGNNIIIEIKNPGISAAIIDADEAAKVNEMLFIALGTPDYQAPEIEYLAEGQVAQKSADIYSLGVVFKNLLHRKNNNIMKAWCDLEDLSKKMCDSNAQNRPTVDQIITQLEPLVNLQTIQFHKSTPPIPAAPNLLIPKVFSTPL